MKAKIEHKMRGSVSLTHDKKVTITTENMAIAVRHFARQRPLYARQSLRGKETAGKAIVAVRMAVLHGKGLCRASSSSSLSCVQFFAVRQSVAVLPRLCRAR
jgi:hypothetical protein